VLRARRMAARGPRVRPDLDDERPVGAAVQAEQMMAKTQKKAKATPATTRRKPSVASAPSGPNGRPTPSPAPARGKLARVRLPSPPAKRARADAPVSADDSNEGKYVYCIVKSESPLRFGPLGIGTDPAEVHTVHFRDIAAVVSNAPMVVQDPTRDNVLAHQRVNETVMQQHTVIPMSFGTVFKTDDDIMELLRSAYDAFTDVLNKMQDKFEFGLKVLWDRDQIIRKIEEEDEDIRRLKGEISSQKGSTYFARMQYGRLIDAALQARSERYVAEVFEVLRDVSVASRSNKPIGDRMIMNAAFLVARNLEQAFDARVKDIGQRYDKLTFKYTGPWPPYNFVNIRLKLERAH
jgi:gas vesicle protein GvpL/GvpF